jgi:hypothetical protein
VRDKLRSRLCATLLPLPFRSYSLNASKNNTRAQSAPRSDREAREKLCSTPCQRCRSFFSDLIA